MKVNKVWFFNDLLEKNKRVFKVPVYQRNYDWSDIQCEQLYKDIISASERNVQHFIGTIVYMEDGTSGSGLDEVLVIDGQQRITTLYILILALYNAAKGVSAKIEAELSDYMFNKHCDIKYKIKLKPIKLDDEQLQYLIDNKLDKMKRNSNIYKNYIIFTDLINESLAQGYDLDDILEGIKELEMVEIILDKSQGDEPQKIFESINSTGLELSLADLIRNYLLMDDENQDELYSEYWMEIEKNVGYSNLEDFVINYLKSQVTKSVNNKNAYQIFKDDCEKNNYSHETVLNNLKRTSRYYGAFIGINNYYSNNINEYLSAFYTIKQSTVLPFIFKIFEDYEDKHITEETLCNVLEYLLTYVVRMITCERVKNLGKFMKSLYARSIDGQYENYYERFVKFLNNLNANDRMPTDKEFKEDLIYKPLYKKHTCKYFLSVIENSTKEHIDISNLTIEHILPQKANSAVWKKEIGKSYDEVYDLYLHTLGNLTFTGHNSELGTRSFKDKKKIIEENSKANILNKDVLSAEKWNEVSIKKRADRLANILIDKFAYKKVDVDENNDENCINIDEYYDFSGIKPSGFSFMGEFTKVSSSWVSLLNKFMELAYDLDKNILISLANENHVIENATKIYITHDKRNLRSSKEIGKSGIFYETNLSSNGIVSFIKDLIIQMGYETSDFNIYLSKKEFDITDESTWTPDIIKVGKMVYFFVEDLLKNDQIKQNEINQLKTKEYTQSLFPNTDYPVLADKVTSHIGNSKTKRYRKNPIKYNGIDVFVSTQFYEKDRDAIIKWYKKHKS